MNLPTQDTCFQKWLASQSDSDLRQASREDVGDMIRDRVRVEIERRGLSIVLLARPTSSTDQQ
jgi:hypothetical protein